MTGLGNATGLVLQLNGSNNLPINGDGGFVFPVQLLNGSSYSVQVSSQPDGKTCTVSAGSGTIQSQHVSSVVVNCASDAFTVGGNVTGLAPGASVTLTNGGANLTVTQNGAFAFPTTVNAGATYDVTVSTQPSAPTQVCTVANGSGTVTTANVTDIAVTCVTSTFTVGGTVNGLSGGSVTLQINGGETQAIGQNGPWSFPTALASGSAYEVTVLSHPTGPAQTCTVSGGNGTVAGANVTSVVVDCSGLTFTIGGTLTGLGAGKSITLANGADTLTLNADGTFTFPTAQNGGTSFAVTVTTQPQDQTCTPSGANGTVGSANVTSVVINCNASNHTIGGTVTGLNGTLVLSNGTETRTMTSNGEWAFPTAVTSGTAYTVTVASQPSHSGGGVSQTCTVANGSGSVAGAPVTDIAVTCVTNTFTLAGHVHGLQAGATVTLLNDGGDAKAVVGTDSPTSDTFTFATKVPSGTVFNVSVQGGAPPAGNTTGSPVEQRCEVTSGGNGVMADGDVANVVVTCTTVSHTVAVNVTGLASGSSVTTQLVRTATAATPTPETNSSSSPALTSNGPFTFTTLPVFSGQDYAVSVTVQPVYAGGGANQTCTVGGNATGTIGNADVTVTVTCVTNRFQVSGVLQNLLPNSGTNTVTVRLESPASFATNPANDVTLNQNGAFSFLDPDLRVLSGAPFSISVQVQPNDPPQTCDFIGGTTFNGTMQNSEISGIVLDCSNDTFLVGGVAPNGGIQGLVGTVRLRNVVSGGSIPPANPPDDLEDFTQNGDWNFTDPVATTKTYTVSVDTHPTFHLTGTTVDGRHQNCDVTDHTGTVTNAPINNIDVTCTTVRHRVTGIVQGYVSGAATPLQISEGGGGATVSCPTAKPAAPTDSDQWCAPTGNANEYEFAFPKRDSGSIYNVSVNTAPVNPDQACQVTSQGNGVIAGTGYIQNADVTGVTVSCQRRTKTIFAVVHGLIAGTTVHLQNTYAPPANPSPAMVGGVADLSITGTGDPTFAVVNAFSPALQNGSTYDIQIAPNPSASQPTNDQWCTVVNGAGTVPTTGLPPELFFHIYCGVTCRGIQNSRPSATSGVYLVDGDGVGSLPASNAYCDMTGDGGGWTLVLKANGNNATFNYSNALWTNAETFGSAAAQANFDLTEGKNIAYSAVSFDAVRVMLRDDTNQNRSVIIPQTYVALRSLMSLPTTGALTVGRAAWLATLDTPSGQLQANCNARGFNIAPGGAEYARVRIGIVGNNEDHCSSPDSWLGIGGQLGTASAGGCGYPGGTPNTTVGNVSPNDGSCGVPVAGSQSGRETEAWGFVWVK